MSARLATWLGAALLTAGCALAQAQVAAAPAKTVGDLLGNRVPVHKDNGKVGSQAKAMQSYQEFLKLQNTDPRLRAEALRRLADLNLESGELDRMSSEVTAEDLQGAEAIRLYTTLLKAYPDYPRNDQVLYQLARAYETTGQSEQALATLDTIAKRYPNARDNGEVQFRRGELLFSAKRYPEAETAYAAVIARGAQGSGFYTQSLYKHGWSVFKQGQNEESLPSFAGVLDQTLLDAKHGGAARSLDALPRADKELVEDTLRVMCISLSYLDGAKSIDPLLAQHNRLAYAWLLYARLGDLYVQKQRYQDAASTYRAFVARDPVDPHAPVLSMQAIQAYTKGGFTDLVLEGKTEFVRSYGFDAPFWQGREHSAYPEVVTELKDNLKDLAQHYHATAQQTKKAEDYALAARWYRAYLAFFPGEAESAETNYLLADALFESHQYGEAVTEYEHTAYDYPPGNRSAVAGYAVLVSYQKQEELLPAAQKAAWHAKAVDAGLKFSEHFPDHPETPGVLTRAAQDVFASADLPRAIGIANLLLAHQPPVDQAKQRIAWTIIGQAQFTLGVFDQSELGFTRALALTPPGDPQHADLTERLAAAVYNQADSKRKSGDDAGAAADFLRVGAVAPGSKVVVTAQYNAAAELINAKKWDQAVSVLEAYRRDYPNSEFKTDIGHKLAVAYGELGRDSLAAAEYERIATNPAEDPAVAREATVRAAGLYEKSGDTARTVAMLELQVRNYPTPIADAIEARAHLAELARKQGNADRLRYWQTEIVRADGSAGSARTDRTRFLAAGARLALAAPARDAFRAIQLTAPLKKTLAAKKAALEVALLEYKAVASYEVAATTTAATYEMAELYRTLAHDLLASERPKKLSAEEQEQYTSLLEEQAYPIEEQAIAIHELNAQRTRDGLYDDSVRKSLQALAELKPARYGKTERSEELIGTLPADAPAGAGDGLQRAVQLALAGKSTDAQLELQQLQLTYPTLAEPAIDLGLLLRGAGQLEPAKAAFSQATERQPASAVAWDELGVTLRQMGQFTEARAAYEHAIAADDSYALAHRNIAVLLDLYMGEPALALDEMEKYRSLSGEGKPVTGWIAELRTRTGIKLAPAAAPAAPEAEPAPSDPSAGKT